MLALLLRLLEWIASEWAATALAPRTDTERRLRAVLMRRVWRFFYRRTRRGKAKYPAPPPT